MNNDSMGSEEISSTQTQANSVRRSLLGGAGTLLAGGAAALPLLMKSASVAAQSLTSWFVPTSFTSAGIQAAIDSANAQGGGCVFLPPGLYIQNHIVKVYDNIRVVGSGRGNTIIQPMSKVTTEPGYGGSICFIAAQRSSVESLTIDLRTNQTVLNGISLLPNSSNPSFVCDGCTVQDCEVLGFDFHLYLIWNFRARNTKILFNYIDGGVTSYDSTSNQEGIEVFGGYNVLILGNKIKNVGHAGLYPQPSVGIPNAENVNIEVCHNQIENCGVGIQAGSCYDSTNGVQWLENINIHHNQIRGCFDYGIQLFGAQTACLYKNVKISENQITSTPVGLINDFQTSIPLGNQSGIVWSGNQVDGGNGGTGGVLHFTYLQNAVVTNNTVTNSTGATAFFLYQCGNVTFAGNVCENINGSALILQYCDSCRFTENVFLNYNVQGRYNAIPLYAVTNSVITHNSFKPAIERYCTQGAADSHELTITQNYLMYSPVVATPFVVPGANANQGMVIMPSGSNRVTVHNSKVQAGTRIQISQIAGNMVTPFMVQPLQGQFTITIPVSGDGSQLFFWEVIQ